MQRKSLMRAGAVVFATLVLLVLSTSVTLFAQLTTGKVEGTVRDKDTGQPLAGAQVTVEGTRLGNVTNTDGYYFILNVPPGLQSVTFTYTGYQKTTVANVMILAGQTITVDGALSSTVIQIEGITIEGESEVLRPRDETTTKRRVTAEQLAESPVTKLDDLLVLSAGVQSGGGGGMSRGLRIRGGRLGEEGMVVDGIMVRNYTANPFTGGSWIIGHETAAQSEDTTPLEFSTESIEQVDIITGGFQAEYGNAQSGIINIVTREGGPQLKGSVRFITDEINPRTADYGYNQLQARLGGPLGIPNLYFMLTGEIQGMADRIPTHADEGFRGVNQTFVDRLNESVRNDPDIGGKNVFTLEKFKTGQAAYGLNTGGNQALFEPGNPVRLPHNWEDGTRLSGKLTFAPTEGLKFIASHNFSRPQNSYPSGQQNGEGNYFKNGIFYKGDPLWDLREWGPDTVVNIHQAYGRRTFASNFLGGFNWD
ncbi:MAG: TonB-dependent receptor, partial [Gemmatimonadota bacterium]|nr:TonB-dependent receptor [Gemmatimonadota bacterium]